MIGGCGRSGTSGAGAVGRVADADSGACQQPCPSILVILVSIVHSGLQRSPFRSILQSARASRRSKEGHSAIIRNAPAGSWAINLQSLLLIVAAYLIWEVPTYLSIFTPGSAAPSLNKISAIPPSFPHLPRLLAPPSSFVQHLNSSFRSRHPSKQPQSCLAFLPSTSSRRPVPPSAPSLGTLDV